MVLDIILSLIALVACFILAYFIYSLLYMKSYIKPSDKGYDEFIKQSKTLAVKEDTLTFYDSVDNITKILDCERIFNLDSNSYLCKSENTIIGLNSIKINEKYWLPYNKKDLSEMRKYIFSNIPSKMTNNY